MFSFSFIAQPEFPHSGTNKIFMKLQLEKVELFRRCEHKRIVHLCCDSNSPNPKTLWSQSISYHRPTLTTWALFSQSMMEWREGRSRLSIKCQRYVVLCYVVLCLLLFSSYNAVLLHTHHCDLLPLRWQTVEKLLDLLGTLDQWINETPPVDQPSRFGNKAFRTWYGKLDQVCARGWTSYSWTSHL